VVVDCGGGQIRLLMLPHQIWVRAEFSLHNFVTYSYCGGCGGGLWDVLPLDPKRASLKIDGSIDLPCCCWCIA
jgi:hypothetical protein